ncbi:MAG: type IV pilus modification PilV family protein [Planctomycetota bacterium]|jgi:prepilin-type N-terminal cleavage/methylation domain-containing protein
MLNKKVTKRSKQMTNEGFTLVEVMIGMAIFLIGFLAVGSMQIAAINGNADAREATEAATRATDQLETLIALPFESIVDGDSVDGAVSWEVLDGTPALNTPLPDTKTITVTVTWEQRGPRSFEVTYMKANNL